MGGWMSATTPGDRQGRPARYRRSRGDARPLACGDPAELDSAEELPTRQQVPYQWHRDAEFDGITMRDPDGLGFVLLWVGEKVPANGAPAWLYWCY